MTGPTIDIIPLQVSPEGRRREFQAHMRYFGNQLSYVYFRMPVKMRFDITTKELIHIIDPEWQKIIDKITKLRDEHIKEYFPEFYNPESK